jgi:predicted GNAT family acetyltransferase
VAHLDIKKGSSCFYAGESEEEPLAVIKFVDNYPNTIVIQSTYVAEELRGQNIARQLVQHVADMARKEQKKIVPFCSYVIALFNKTDEFDDVAAKG